MKPMLVESNRNLVVSSQRQIALIDVEDLLVVDTPDALMLAKRGSSQKVSAVAKALKSQHSSLMDTHTTTYRPWGCFENLLDEPGYKVKRIIVYPGQKLSLQRHKHRAEHWTVVEGSAWVRNGDSEFSLNVSESTFIPQGAIHRLENRTESLVVLIEVQTGAYTGEDDIERLEDIYGRIG
jgi:mannose-1-phosphate guanylyltransferase